jgi:hypothetical protein
MKIPNPCTFLLLLVVAGIFLTAGCSQQGQDSPIPPVTSPSAPETTPQSGLAAMAFSPADMPFAVMNETTEEQLPDPAEPDPFGLARAYMAGYASEEADSPTAIIVMETLAEYPRENVTAAFTLLEAQLTGLDNTGSTVTLLADPGIGDDSFALTLSPATGDNGGIPLSMIGFRKANIVAIVVMKSQSGSTAMLQPLAVTAAGKIPATGTDLAAPPITSSSPAGTVSLAATAQEPAHTAVVAATSSVAIAGPVTVSASNDNAAGTITFGINNPGTTDLGLERMEFTVSTPCGLWSGKYGDAKVTADAASVKPGETVNIVLNTVSLDVSPSGSGSLGRFILSVKPAIGAPLSTWCSVPVPLVAGQTATCK